MGEAPPKARDRPHRPSGRWRRARDLWRDQRSCHRRCRQGRAGRHRLLPADRELPGKDLRRRQDPGGLFQARGAPHREGNIDLTPDRPADPAAVRLGLQERDASDRHRALPRHGERPRYRGDGGGLGRAYPFRGPLPRADRGGPRRLYRRPVCAQSDDRRNARERTRSGGGRHRRCGADGRIGGEGALRGDHARRRDVRAEALPAGDRRHRQIGRACRQGAF